MMPWNRGPVENIVVCGYENPKSKRRQDGGPGARVYGHREADTAQRLVAVVVDTDEATQLIKLWNDTREEQILEVPTNRWFHVAVVGKEEMFSQTGEMT